MSSGCPAPTSTTCTPALCRAPRSARRTRPETATSTHREMCWPTPRRCGGCGATRERCRFTGLRIEGGRVAGVDTSDGPIDTEHVVLTGGPKLAEVGATAGSRVPAGGARHQVVVTAPVTAFNVHDVPMVFDLPSGIYWRPGEAGGLLWGMSNPEEAPGVAADFDEIYYQKVRGRIEELLPGLKGLGLRRTWAATIDYTPDHLPIIGPLLTDDGPVEGTVVASPAGHGMMWGPAVAEVAVDLTMTGRCEWPRPPHPR